MMSLHNLGTDYAMYRAKTLHPDPNAHGNIGKMPTGKLSDPRPYLRHLISRKRYTFCCVTIDPGSGHPRVSAGRSPLLPSCWLPIAAVILIIHNHLAFPRMLTGRTSRVEYSIGVNWVQPGPLALHLSVFDLTCMIHIWFACSLPHASFVSGENIIVLRKHNKKKADIASCRNGER